MVELSVAQERAWTEALISFPFISLSLSLKKEKSKKPHILDGDQ